MPENTANNAASYTTPWDTITLLDRYLQQMSVSVVACPRNQRFKHSRANPAGSFLFFAAFR